MVSTEATSPYMLMIGCKSRAVFYHIDTDPKIKRHEEEHALFQVPRHFQPTTEAKYKRLLQRTGEEASSLS